MTYKLKTIFWDEPSVVDEFDNADEAYEAYTYIIDAARDAPKSVVGYVRSVTLSSGDGVVRKYSF